jgi:putative endonuclease
MPAWFFYILRLRSGSLYIGATTDLEKRYEEHCTRKGCRTTALDLPIALLYSEMFETFPEARQREAQVKRWSRAKKEALISGDIAKLKKLAKSRRGLLSPP